MNFNPFKRWDRAKGNGKVEPVQIVPDEESEVEDTQTLAMKCRAESKKYRQEATEFAEQTSVNLERPDAR